MVDFSEKLNLWLEDVARSLRFSFENYWPADADGKKDPCEQNLAFHFAHVLLSESRCVFAEVDHPDRSIQGIDLLAVAPDEYWFLAAEFKRLLCDKGSGTLKGFLNDIERLERFWLNTTFQPNYIGEKRCEVISNCQKGFGLVAGLLWVPKSGQSIIHNFWKTKSIENDSIHFTEMNDKLNKLKAYWPEPVLAWNESVGSSYYLLAAAFEIPHPTHNTSERVDEGWDKSR